MPAPQNQQPALLMNVTAPWVPAGANDTCTNTQRYISSYSTIGYLWWDGFSIQSLIIFRLDRTVTKIINIVIVQYFLCIYMHLESISLRHKLNLLFATIEQLLLQDLYTLHISFKNQESLVPIIKFFPSHEPFA